MTPSPDTPGAPRANGPNGPNGPNGVPDRPESTLIEALVRFVRETPPAAIPETVLARTRLFLWDAISIALANRDAPYVRSLDAVIEAAAAAGRASRIGGGTRLHPEAAAERNSSAIHGSDLDPTHLRSIIHPTAVAVPVGLAVAEDVDASLDDAVVAIALGMEAHVRLGLAAAGRYHLAGFQATALLGPVIAAAIDGRLRDRPVAEIVAAAGLSTAIAAGLRSFSDDGTWGKRLITGWACRAGLHASALARAGWPGSRDALEKRWGLFPAFLREPLDPASALAGLGEAWHLLDTDPKRFPCSHGLHPFIASAIALRPSIGDPDGIAAVRCGVNHEAARWWFEPTALRYRPDAYGARFSIPYAVARALLDGVVDDAAFEAEAVADERVLALTARVAPRFDPDLEGRKPVGLPGGLEIELADGRRLALDEEPPEEDGEALILGRAGRWVTAALGPARSAALQARVLGDDPPGGSVRELLDLADASAG